MPTDYIFVKWKILTAQRSSCSSSIKRKCRSIIATCLLNKTKCNFLILLIVLKLMKEWHYMGDSQILRMFSALEKECKNKMRIEKLQGYGKRTV